MSKQGYDTDLADAQGGRLAPLLPPPGIGHPPHHPPPADQWRLLPKDSSPWATVYHHCRQWRDDGTWQQMLHPPQTAVVRPVPPLEQRL